MDRLVDVRRRKWVVWGLDGSMWRGGEGMAVSGDLREAILPVTAWAAAESPHAVVHFTLHGLIDQQPTPSHPIPMPPLLPFTSDSHCLDPCPVIHATLRLH